MLFLKQILTVSQLTALQLIRMKTLFILLGVGLLVLISSTFEFEISSNLSQVISQQLTFLKSTSLGAMTLFSTLFGIAATAILLPKDIEDKTLHLLLSKPLPKISYLLGKFLGVMLVIATSLFLLALLSSLLITLKQSQLIANLSTQAVDLEWLATAKSSSPINLSFHLSVISLLLKSSVVVSIALLISVFSTSTLFTSLVTGCCYLIGNYQSIARDYWFDEKNLLGTGIEKFLSLIISLLFPDFGLFDIGNLGAGEASIPLISIAQLFVLSLFYCGFYLSITWFIFANKEF